MQALLLAAGMGKRLEKFTKDNTKCMVEVAGKKLKDRTIEAVLYAGIKKFIIVIGYQGNNLKNYVLDNYSDCGLEFIFIDNKDYAISNNIYSFYLAKEYIEKEDTVLLDSDLIYEKTFVPHLASCVIKYTRPDGRFIYADPGRTALQQLATILGEHGMEYDIVPDGDIWLMPFTRKAP